MYRGQAAVTARLLYASSYRKASQADSRGAGVYSHSQHHPLRFEAREHSHLRHEQVRIWRNRHLERSSSLSILADPTLPPISSSRRPIRSTSSRVPTELRRSFWGSILTNELTFGRWVALLPSCSRTRFSSTTIPWARCLLRFPPLLEKCRLCCCR